MKKLIALLLACIMVLGLLTACGSKKEDTAKEDTAKEDTAATDAADAAENTDAADDTEEPAVEEKKDDGSVDIGVVLPTNEESRWLQDEAQFRELAKTAGYNIEVLYSQRSSATERSNVESLIAKGMKVLFLCSPDAAAAASTVEMAHDEGVTVIAYDRMIPDTEKLDYYLSYDSVAIGAAMGQHLIDNAEGTGNPLYLYAGALTDNNAFLLFEGAWSVLQPKIADGTFVIKNSSMAEKYIDQPSLTVNDNRAELSEIIGQITTNWDFNEAKSKAEANLTSASAEDKGLCYILAGNDDTARPIADVFAGDKDVTGYFIPGQDAEKASIQYIIDGKQTMTVFKDIRIFTQVAMDIATAILEGGEPETNAAVSNGVIDVPSIMVEFEVVTKDNVKEAMVDSGYYQASDFTGLE